MEPIRLWRFVGHYAPSAWAEGLPAYGNPVEYAALTRADFDALVKERDEARAESAAVVCAIQEISIGAGLPSVIIGRTRDANGTERDWALRPEQIRGLTEAIRRRVEDCATFGRGAVRSHQDIDAVKDALRAATARADKAEKDRDDARALAKSAVSCASSYASDDQVGCLCVEECYCRAGLLDQLKADLARIDAELEKKK